MVDLVVSVVPNLNLVCLFCGMKSASHANNKNGVQNICLLQMVFYFCLSFLCCVSAALQEGYKYLSTVDRGAFQLLQSTLSCKAARELKSTSSSSANGRLVLVQLTCFLAQIARKIERCTHYSVKSSWPITAGSVFVCRPKHYPRPVFRPAV